MRKFLVLLLALVVVCSIHSGAFADDNDKLSVETDTGTVIFKIDENGEMNYRAFNETITTNDTVTAAESGKVFFVASTPTPAEVTLPAVSTVEAGSTYTFIDGNTVGFVVSPNAVDRVQYLTMATGDSMRSPGTMGASVTVWASDDSVWWATTTVAFTDVN